MPEFSCPPNEVCRPTFWNIPEWMQLTLYTLSVVSIGLFFFGFFRHYQFWRRGKAPYKVDDIPRRIKNFLTLGVATRKTVAENQPAGFMHFNLMWGMVLLFIGTALATIDWDIARLIFDRRILQGAFYFFYKTVLDLAGLASLVGLAIAIYLRYGKKQRRLWGYGDGRWHFDDDLWVAMSFLTLVISGFTLESLRIAATHPWWQAYSPFGSLLANLWVPLGEETIRGLHLGVWTLHSALTLFWIAYLPATKWFHIFSSSTNTFFKQLERPKAIAPILNIEEQESFGIAKFEEFSWKQAMDFDACTRCGRCQAVCPASQTAKLLSPKMIEVKLANYGRHLPASAAKRIHYDTIDPQELWDCTTCMACVEACPVGIDQLSTIIDLRRYLTLSEGAVQPAGAKAMDSMERQGNPYGMPRGARWDVLQDLDVEFAKPGVAYDLLYWVGCAGAYDSRNQKITRAVVKILKAAGVNFAIMQKERCNCESARRLGNEYLYQAATAENVQNLGAFQFKRILTQCPHCFNTLKNEYPQFEGKYDVIHHSQYIAELIGNGRIRPRQTIQDTVTYHDSCYLGRYNGIFEPQREIIKTISPAGSLVEMAASGEKGLCCGGGGGRMWLEENTGTRINQLRVQQAVDTKAKTVVSACPFCMTMLEDGAKGKGVDETLQRRDIAELVAEGL